MTTDLSGKVAIVTGAGGPVGREVALSLARAGAKVAVNDLGCAADGRGASEAPARAVAQQIVSAGGEALASFGDVTKVGDVEEMVGAAFQRFGRVDILVTCAGVVREKSFLETTEDDWDTMVRVHMKGTFLCVRYASSLMRQQRWGRIITMSGAGGVAGSADSATYGAAMSGVLGLTRTASRDLGRTGVTCNAIVPIVSTRGLREEDSVFAANLLKLRPVSVRDALSPDSVGALAVYLSSDAAASINGQVFIVAGKMVSFAPVAQPRASLYQNGIWKPRALIQEARKHFLPHIESASAGK